MLFPDHTGETSEKTVSFCDAGSSTDSFLSSEAAQAARGFELAEMATLTTNPTTGQLLTARMVWRKKEGTPARSSGGRLGVLIPTLNCREALEKQVEVMSGWLDLIDELVVIDSHSTDGTAEYLAQAFKGHPCLRVVRHPRGLWQSWNAGLALLTTEYVLVSTVGDTMERSGIEHLLEVAGQTSADIVLSPPEFASHDGAPPPQENWPIHILLSDRRLGAPEVLSPEDAATWTFRFGGLSQGLLGSSASNLYRTRLLQEFPFPVDTGPAGDVAWGLRHIHRAKVAITPQKCALFVHHPKAAVSHNRIRGLLLPHACAAIGITQEQAMQVLGGCQSLVDQEQACVQALQDLRARVKKGWLLRPQAWRLRRQRKQLRASLEAFRRLEQRIPAYFKVYLENYRLHREYWQSRD